MDVPTVELFETAVTFDKSTPIRCRRMQCLPRTFGKKAGVSFVFRADTASEGRYWVYSGDPWLEPPAEAVSALAPKRLVVQLCEGLPYRFALEACVGREALVDGEKEVEPFRTTAGGRGVDQGGSAEVWLQAGLLQRCDQRVAVSPTADRTIKLPYASIEGVLQVTDAELLKRPLLRGIGSYRRVGLGLLQLSN